MTAERQDGGKAGRDGGKFYNTKNQTGEKRNNTRFDMDSSYFNHMHLWKEHNRRNHKFNFLKVSSKTQRKAEIWLCLNLVLSLSKTSSNNKQTNKTKQNENRNRRSLHNYRNVY